VSVFTGDILFRRCTPIDVVAMFRGMYEIEGRASRS